MVECPPGYFLFNENVCFKSEYRTKGSCDVYCDSGEYFWGGVKTRDERNELKVQPLVPIWIEAESIHT